jgi:hypothetical protein
MCQALKKGPSRKRCPRLPVSTFNGSDNWLIWRIWKPVGRPGRPGTTGRPDPPGGRRRIHRTRPGPPAENTAGRCRPPAVRCRHQDPPVRREPADNPESGSTPLPVSGPRMPLWTKACSSSGRVPVASATASNWTTAGCMGPEHCVPPVARQCWSTPIPPLPVDWTISTAPTSNR